MEPTEVQIKEFWEWCGIRLEINKDGSGLMWYALGKSNVPLGFYKQHPLPITLDNLFKDAVPKLINLGYNVLLQNCTLGWFASIEPHFGVFVDSEHEDPALALFWAIWEATNESR